MKHDEIYGGVMIVASFLLSYGNTTLPLYHLIKCLLAAYGITLLTYSCCRRHIHKAWTPLYCLGVILLSVYTVLALDTYVFHTLTWFPGIIRYALFSTYGLWYIVFVIPGVLLCFHDNHRS